MTILLMLATLTTAASMTWLMINPLTMGLTILIMSMSVALLFAMTLSSWMAFLVFLIYIGGMMVMFAYFVATSPNMPMNMFWPIMFSLSTFSILMIVMLSSSTKLTTSTPSMALNTFYSPQLMETLLMLALILLLTMVIVVKLVSLNKGPLRPFN